MGFIKKNLEKLKKDMVAANDAGNAYTQREKLKYTFVCICGGIMTEPIFRAGGMLRKRIVRCDTCGKEMLFEQAQKELQHPPVI